MDESLASDWKWSEQIQSYVSGFIVYKFAFNEIIQNLSGVIFCLAVDSKMSTLVTIYSIDI